MNADMVACEPRETFRKPHSDSDFSEHVGRFAILIKREKSFIGLLSYEIAARDSGDLFVGLRR